MKSPPRQVILLSQARQQRKNSTLKAAFIFIPFNLREHQYIINRKSSLSPTVCNSYDEYNTER